MVEAVHESRFMCSRWKKYWPGWHSLNEAPQAKAINLVPQKLAKTWRNGPLKWRCRSKHTSTRHECQVAARKAVWAQLIIVRDCLVDFFKKRRKQTVEVIVWWRMLINCFLNTGYLILDYLEVLQKLESVQLNLKLLQALDSMLMHTKLNLCALIRKVTSPH